MLLRYIAVPVWVRTGDANLQRWGVPMLNIVKSYLSDENGAAAAEYALILAIIGTGIAAAAVALGGSISGALNAAATCITAKGC